MKCNIKNHKLYFYVLTLLYNKKLTKIKVGNKKLDDIKNISGYYYLNKY